MMHDPFRVVLSSFSAITGGREKPASRYINHSVASGRVGEPVFEYERLTGSAFFPLSFLAPHRHSQPGREEHIYVVSAMATGRVLESVCEYLYLSSSTFFH